MARIRSTIIAYVLDGKWVRDLFPVFIMALYFVSLSRFLSWLLPECRSNVNAYFAGKASMNFLVLGVVLYLVFLVLFKLAKGKKPNWGGRKERPRLGDLFLILPPLTPVAQYVINNQDILSPLGSLYVLAVFAAFSFLFIILIPMLFGLIGSARALMLLGLAFTFTITNMASISAWFHWLERGTTIIQLALFGVVFLAGSLLYNLAGRKFMYFVVAVFFVANTTTQLVSGDREQTSRVGKATDNQLEKLVGSRKPLSTPNIYLLVYDAYVANETMLKYGIDNKAQEQYLVDLGFKLYPRTYSIAGFTIGSMGRVLDASADFRGHFKKSVSGNGTVHNLLKSFGYSTCGIFYGDFFFQVIGSSYDSSFPHQDESPSLSAGYHLLMKAIFMGEFRFDVGFDKPTRTQFEEKKSHEFGNVPDRPRFIYMHDDLPGHSQNSGTRRPNEIALYAKRLIRANLEMKKDVGLITAKDPGAIIIMAGDHGPYLTKNSSNTADDFDISEISRLDVQDRYGTFLAIRWPGDGPAEYDDITVLQDMFPAIFAFLFEDENLLGAKVESLTQDLRITSGVSVENGIIHGGINDGEPLFLNRD